MTLIPAACSVGGLGFGESPGRELAPCACALPLGAFSGRREVSHPDQIRQPGCPKTAGKCAPVLPKRHPKRHLRLLVLDNTKT